MKRITGAFIVAACLTLFTTSSLAYPNWLVAYADCMSREDPACATSPKASPLIHETASTRSELERLSRRVNEKMTFAAVPGDALDRELYGVSDFWTSQADIGDCEDMQLVKILALTRAGYPRGALRMAIVDVFAPVISGGDGTPGSSTYTMGRVGVHAIALVYTDRHPKDPYVLDNLTDTVQLLSVVLRRHQYRLQALQDARGVWLMLH